MSEWSYAHTKRHSSEGEVVVHELPPRDHHGSGSVVVEAIVLVDMAGDDSSVGEFRAVQRQARVADAVAVIWGQQSVGGGAGDREDILVTCFHDLVEFTILRLPSDNINSNF